MADIEPETYKLKAIFVYTSDRGVILRDIKTEEEFFIDREDVILLMRVLKANYKED